MKRIAIGRILRWVLLMALVVNGYADVKSIGDIQRLENWTGLIESDQKTTCGDSAAMLKAPGKAVFEYTEPKSYTGWETPAFSDMLDEVAVEDWSIFPPVDEAIGTRPAPKTWTCPLVSAP